MRPAVINCPECSDGLCLECLLECECGRVYCLDCLVRCDCGQDDPELALECGVPREIKSVKDAGFAARDY